ncbi:TetR family transcriptional regulator C-terminal domain-containing protein [Nocardia sp. NPDC060256]|uniref:TetR family transcriptional regulator C-terminal domain-containing protein n=1 Tax=unclassified Nocardia TaxID=2637762 RepID=UPI00364AAFB3
MARHHHPNPHPHHPPLPNPHPRPQRSRPRRLPPRLNPARADSNGWRVAYWLTDPAEQHRRRVSVLVWAESLVDDRLRSIVGDGIGQRALALEAIRSGQAAGTVTRHADADAITRLALALIQGFVLQQAWEPGVDIEGYRRALDLVIDALTPRPAG